jgi:four helix bundle protein
MSGLQRFEDLIAWQKARDLTRAIYTITRQSGFAPDIGLVRQLQQAPVSIMVNIAEGFERNNPGEFHQFLSIAKSSCAEVRSHLYVAFDAHYVDRQTFDQAFNKAEEVARLIGGLRASVQRQRDTQRKRQ